MCLAPRIYQIDLRCTREQPPAHAERAAHTLALRQGRRDGDGGKGGAAAAARQRRAIDVNLRTLPTHRSHGLEDALRQAGARHSRHVERDMRGDIIAHGRSLCPAGTAPAAPAARVWPRCAAAIFCSQVERPPAWTQREGPCLGSLSPKRVIPRRSSTKLFCVSRTCLSTKGRDAIRPADRPDPRPARHCMPGRARQSLGNPSSREAMRS